MDRVEEARRLRAESRKDARHLFAAGLQSAFRADWPAARLSDIASEIRNGWSGKEDKEGVEARVLRLSAVHGLTINAAESRPVQLRSADATAFPVRRDEVFVVRGNGSKHLVGRSAIATQDHPGLIFNDLLMRVVPDRTRLRPDFLNYCLHTPSVRRQIEDAAKTAAGIWKINQTTLGAVRIPCPDLETQAKTVEVARALHENNQALFQRLEEFPTERLSAAILRKAFSGEL
jgi:type I restriction enzyme S subunit